MHIQHTDCDHSQAGGLDHAFDELAFHLASEGTRWNCRYDSAFFM